MKKYKVEITQTETFIVDVLADNENEAIEKANVKFEAAESIGTEHYMGTGNGGREIGYIYDVTDTDDPFNP